MSLLVDTLDAVRRLTALVLEENAALEARRGAADLKPFAEAKAQLADRLAALDEAMKRAGRTALAAELPQLRATLRSAIDEMNAALAMNAALLERRKSLSEGIIEAVLGEARRQAGTQLAGYGKSSPREERAAAIAYNGRA